MWWLILVAVLALQLFVPIGILGSYQQGCANLWLRIGPFRTKLYPRQRQPKKKQKTDVKSSKGFEEKRSTKKKSPGSISDFFPLVNLVLDFLDTFRKKLRINRLIFNATLAEEDPVDLSIHYGQAWSALGSIVPFLDRYFVIKKRDLEIQCDYTASETVIYAELDATITAGNILAIAAYHGIRILRKFLKIMSKRKGGVIT